LSRFSMVEDNVPQSSGSVRNYDIT
jgi:hypothetical protein